MVPGFGNRKSKIVVLGEAPASNEVRIGRPFVGRAGEELQRLFKQVGMDLDRDAYRTNASLEPVSGEKQAHFFEQDGKPSQVLIQGLMALMQDLNEIKPNVVVPMGNYALWAMKQHMDIMKWRGSILWSDVFKVKTIPTIHPAALMWDTQQEGGSGLYKYRPVIIWDLERVRDQSQFPEVKLKHRTYLVNPTGSDREYALERLRAARRLTFDVEAPRRRIGLKCISFSDFDPTWAVCFWHYGTETLELFRSLLETDVPKVGQNLMYDATLLWQLGINVRGIQHDTLLAQRTLLCDLPLGLDFMTSVYTDIPYYKDEGKEHGDKEDPIRLMTYCCKDSCATTDVAIEQEAQFAEEPGSLATFHRSMGIFDPLRDTPNLGIKVNRQVLSELMQEAEQKRAKYQSLVNQEAGYEVNVKSAPQISHLVYDVRGLAPGRKTRSTEQNILMDIAARTQDRLLVNIVRTREARTSLSNFLNYDILSPDGRLRWEYKIAGTKTGRLACQAPSWGPGVNGQTLPPSVRRMLEPDDGWEFCEADGMQAESIITAVYAQDPVHLECFRTGKDVHRVTACLLIDKPIDQWATIDKSSNLRQLSKICNHAFDYDMGYITFMFTVNLEWDPDDPQSLRLDQTTAKVLKDKYMSIRPAIPGYWEWVRARLKEDGLRLTNVFGRTRLFLDKWSDTMHKDAYSWLPQGTIGDYTNIGILQTKAALVRASVPHRLVAQTHDSATWTYPKEARDTVVPLILSNSEVPIALNGILFTVPVEASVGGSLRKCEPKDPPDWLGLKEYGKSRKVIDLTPGEYERMTERMKEAIDG